MKKILIIMLCILILFTACGCKKATATDTVSSPEVTINMPKDDTVNGYRIESEKSDASVPDSISGDEVEIGTVETDKTATGYCANKNSKVFHKSDCGSVSNMKESNKYFADRETLISEGYKPCGKCNP